MIKHTKKIINTYKYVTDDINKILLINSWNEWGEQMEIEPSNEKETYYIDLIKNCFIEENMIMKEQEELPSLI